MKVKCLLTWEQRKRAPTFSSSFSIPVGICATARLIGVHSARSGNSSAQYTGIDFVASKFLARNDSLLVVAITAMRCDTMYYDVLLLLLLLLACLIQIRLLGTINNGAPAAASSNNSSGSGI